MSRVFKFLVLALLGSLAAGCDGSHDPSRAAEKSAVASATHPFAGFWKTPDCSDDFGLAVAPAGPLLYSVSFCGPGGCFKPGTYRPNTPLVGDSEYRIGDTNTIEVLGKDGFIKYVRCERR